MRIELGDIAKDAISGMTGVVVGDTQWLHGCRRLTIQPQALHEGRPIDAHTFDELQLELVESKKHKAKKETGGPRPNPVSAKTVKRHG